MKKSLVLGAAALATIMMAAPQYSNAGEVKVGGYYMFRVQDSDATVADVLGQDESRYWVQRLSLKTDFIHDNKTHAHMLTRILDSDTVTGADAQGFGCDSGLAECNAVVGTPGGVGSQWNIRQAWLETEMWGVGLKTGFMPVNLNDGILMNTVDDTGYATILLSKTFGDVSAVLANVRVREGNITGFSTTYNASVAAAQANATATAAAAAHAAAAGDADAAADAAAAAAAAAALTTARANYSGADDDDENLYFLSLFGKFNQIDYNLTGAYYRAENSSTIGSSTANGDAISDAWLAVTLHNDFGFADVTGTVIYETGVDDVASPQASGSGFLTAVRAKGATQIGELNAYGFYSGEDFNNISNDNMRWSATWDTGGPGGRDIFDQWAKTTGVASQSENMAGLGVGLKVNVDSWTINPMLDYATVLEEDYNGNGIPDSRTTEIWGGALAVSTPINKDTTLYFTGVVADPNDEGTRAVQNVASVNTMHYVEASVKMKF